MPEFRGLHVSIEFPVKQQDYPGVWVDFDPTGQLSVAGIGHFETVDDEGVQGGKREFTRWRFQGFASYTLVALSSLQRDLLYDEMVNVLAFGRYHPQRSRFRTYIEDNEFLSLSFDWDEVGQRGFNATPGTPWGTDDIIYEATVQMDVVGEFVSDIHQQVLVPLSEVLVYDYTDREPDPATIPGHPAAPDDGWH